jgi:hypothetical protein
MELHDDYEGSDNLPEGYSCWEEWRIEHKERDLAISEKKFNEDYIRSRYVGGGVPGFDFLAYYDNNYDDCDDRYDYHSYYDNLSPSRKTTFMARKDKKILKEQIAFKIALKEKERRKCYVTLMKRITPSRTPPRTPSGIPSGTLSGILSGTLPDTPSGTLPDTPSDTSSSISSEETSDGSRVSTDSPTVSKKANRKKSRGKRNDVTNSKDSTKYFKGNESKTPQIKPSLQKLQTTRGVKSFW